MAQTHHPHWFSHEWLELHPWLASQLKRAGAALGAGTLLAGSALLVTQLEVDLKTPLQFSPVLDQGASVLAAQQAESYFPAQFTAQAQRAPIEELPPQF